LHSPGHTPEHLSYKVADNESGKELGVISGDFVFVGDVGRPDLLETAAGYEGTMRKSAETLFDSLQEFKKLPGDLMLWPGHGAGSACGKNLGAVPESSVGAELTGNTSILATGKREEFIDYILSGQPEPPAYFARMKEQNRSGPKVLASLPSPVRLDPERPESFDMEQGVVVVDTRPWEEFRRGHYPKSLFVPTTCAMSIIAGSYIDPDSKICLIVHERDLDYVVRQFMRVGVDNIDSYLTPADFGQYVENGGKSSSVREIEIMELPSHFDPDNCQLVDLRRSVELFETGRIAGAHNISHTQLRPRLAELSPDRNLHVYCRTGNRSQYATAFLLREGFEVTHLTGGIFEWMRLQQPVEKVE